MREDRLRALRALRFAARFDFAIDPETWTAIAESAPYLGRLSAERVKQEIEKTMDQVQCPSRAFAMWQKSGAFQTLIPALAAASPVELATIDAIAMPLAAVYARDRMSPSPIAKANRRNLRLIALFAASREATVLEALKALRFSNADANWISGIISRWAEMSAELRFGMTGRGPSDSVLRRWAAMTGRTRLASVLRLAAARWSAERAAGIDAPDAAVVHSAYRRGVRIAYRDPVEISDLAIDGSDLERLGITGPSVGRTLRNLLETVINDPSMNTRDALLAIASSPGRAAST
jgi:tRNA nucleotidyltransferase/poly(A) polymerase